MNFIISIFSVFQEEREFEREVKKLEEYVLFSLWNILPDIQHANIVNDVCETYVI